MNLYNINYLLASYYKSIDNSEGTNIFIEH